MTITPRASGFWATTPSTRRMGSGYFTRGTEGDEEEDMLLAEDLDDGRTPLDRTIDRIGMGSYQWALLSLCGFGWMADNMWIQAVAIILPRVQQHYQVPDNHIGILSSSMFAGMMIGAIGWGTCSDLLGRSAAFNATLFFTSLFGLLASVATSFPVLCISLFLLGSAVGGSMPTDGTLLLEHMPNGKKYLVTALSVFFSFGAVLSAIVGLLVIPQHSCLSAPCNPEDNNGWKYTFMALSCVTLTMFLCRIVFFTLHESPRYLVHAGRPHDAIVSLQKISKFNGDTLNLKLQDVLDVHPSRSPSPKNEEEEPSSRNINIRTMFDEESTPTIRRQTSSTAVLENAKTLDYSSTSNSPPLSPPRPSSPSTSLPPSRPPSISESRKAKWIPGRIRKPLTAWLDRIAMVLSPEWFRTTMLVWTAWCTMSMAYTMFNVFLPKLLETSPTKSDTTPKSIESTLWDVVIFTIGGCPGALLGAWMVESPIGKRWALAGSTFSTAIFSMIFVSVHDQWAVRISTSMISLSATAMWAVLYGWTPEIFGTKVRGTACGIASALSRVGGMIAPLVGGALLMFSRSVPVYTSVVVYVIGGISVLFLSEKPGDEEGERPTGLMH